MKVRISAFLKDIILTGITSIATILSMIIVTRLVAQGLGAEQFGAYSIARRVIASLVPFTTFAMGISLARTLGWHKSDTVKQSAYFLGALIVTLFFTLLICSLGLFAAPNLSAMIFNQTGYVPLFRALLFTLAGSGFFHLLYSYYRGLGKMNRANLLQFLVVAVGFMIVAGLFAQKGSAAIIIYAFGVLYLTTIVLYAMHVYTTARKLSHFSAIPSAARELMNYGWGRIPAGLVFSGLLSFGPLLAPHYYSLAEAGYLVVGQSMFRITESAVIAFGLVALPKVANLISENKSAFINERLNELLGFLIQIGLFVTLHLFLGTELIVDIWLGEDFAPAVPLMRIIVLSILPYLAYVLFRSVIDAVEIKAVNTVNLFAAFSVGIATAVAAKQSGADVRGLAAAITTSMWLLGILTFRSVNKRFKFSLDKIMFGRTVALNIVLAIPVGAMLYIFRGRSSDYRIFVLVFCLESLLGLGYLFFLRRWKAGWIKQIENRVFVSKADVIP